MKESGLLNIKAILHSFVLTWLDVFQSVCVCGMLRIYHYHPQQKYIKRWKKGRVLNHYFLQDLVGLKVFQWPIGWQCGEFCSSNMKQIWPLSGFTIPKMESSVLGAILTLRFGLSQGCITSWFPLLTESLWSKVRIKANRGAKERKPCFLWRFFAGSMRT